MHHTLTNTLGDYDMNKFEEFLRSKNINSLDELEKYFVNHENLEFLITYGVSEIAVYFNQLGFKESWDVHNSLWYIYFSNNGITFMLFGDWYDRAALTLTTN